MQDTEQAARYRLGSLAMKLMAATSPTERAKLWAEIKETRAALDALRQNNKEQ